MDNPDMFGDVPLGAQREEGFKVPDGSPAEMMDDAPEFMGESDGEERAHQPKPKRKGVPLPKRIGQMTYEKKLLEEQLQQAEYLRQTQVAELMRENQSYRTQLAKKEESEIDNLESTIQSNEQVIMNEMRRAKEDQDITAEMKWQRELNELQRASAQIQAHKAARQFQPQEDEYYSEPIVQQPRRQDSVANYNPHFLEWQESTGWANENDPNFSPELLSEADEIAVELNKKLRVARRGDVIGTPEYFSTINEIIEARHGFGSDSREVPSQESDGFYDEQPQHPQQAYQQQPSYHVGGVNRQGATMAEQYTATRGTQGQTRNVRLAPEQEILASNLQIRGRDGRMLSPAEARARYIKHMNAPVAPNGTAYRMRIDHGI